MLSIWPCPKMYPLVKRLNVCIKLKGGNWTEMSDLPLPNNNFFDWSKFKAFADDKINVT